MTLENIFTIFMNKYNLDHGFNTILKTSININNYHTSKLGAFVFIKGYNKIIQNISECNPNEINGMDLVCFEVENINTKTGVYGMSSLGKVYFSIELLKIEFKKRKLFPNSLKGYILCKKRTEDLDQVISFLNLELEIISENQEINKIKSNKKNYNFNSQYHNQNSEEYRMIHNYLNKNFDINFYDNKEYVLPEFTIANRKIDALVNLDSSQKFIYSDKSKIVDVSNRDLLLIQAKSRKELNKHGLMGVMGQTYFAVNLMKIYYQNIKSVRGIALVDELPKDQIGIYETFKDYGEKDELKIKLVERLY